MQIRNKLTIRFTLIVATILVVFSAIIYYLYSDFRKQEFYSRLRDKALTTVKLYSKDVKEIDPALLHIIDKNSIDNLPDEDINIYDVNGHEVYDNPHDDVLRVLPVNILNKVIINKEILYKEGNNECIGIYFRGQFNDQLIIIASGYDKYGYEKLNFLKEILIISCILTIGVIGFAGYFFSKQAFKPITDVVQQVQNINASNLNYRVNAGAGKDEIARLANTFNEMLNRIEEAFEIQRSFVSNASHELRTPLTAIKGQLEVALINKRAADEYKSVLSSVLEDMKDLNRLTNGLLELTQANMDMSSLNLQPIRIDEVLWLAKSDLQKRNPEYMATVKVLDFPEDENRLLVYGNQLLRAALLNVMDNACKFSPDKHVYISFQVKLDTVVLTFIDKGIGISKEDMARIYQPFYRGTNAKSYSGHGLGLSLTKKIIELHKGEIVHIESVLDKGTTVIIMFPIYDKAINKIA